MIKRIIAELRKRYFPTSYDRMVSRWYEDGGNERFRFDYDLEQNSLVVDLGGYAGSVRASARLITF